MPENNEIDNNGNSQYALETEDTETTKTEIAKTEDTETKTLDENEPPVEPPVEPHLTLSEITSAKHIINNNQYLAESTTGETMVLFGSELEDGEKILITIDDDELYYDFDEFVNVYEIVNATNKETILEFYQQNFKNEDDEQVTPVSPRTTEIKKKWWQVWHF